MTLSDYEADGSRPRPRADIMALVRISGTILSGSGHDSPFDDDALSTAEDVVEALETAARAKEVRAVVLRIDSLGGTYPAADAIADAVARVRAQGKPVVVSMSDVAASGGTISRRCGPTRSLPIRQPLPARSACSACGR